MNEKPEIRRMRLIIAISLIAALLILIRFAFIMLGKGKSEPLNAQSPALSERGPIVSRKGQIVALQTRLWSVTAWKPDVEDPIETAKLIAPILKKDPLELSRLLTGGTSSQFVFIKRQISPTESDAIAPLIESGQLKGIALQEELSRHYPMKDLAAPLIGYVGTDNVGLDGIEYAFDRVLAPGDIGIENQRIYGDTVHLTLDMDLQYLVQKIAEDAFVLHNPESMMVILADAMTAEILAWVSLPTFDPNNFTQTNSSQRINRPLVEAYEPGSVFKIFTWATLLETGNINPDDVFDTSGGYNPDIFRRYGIAPITDLANYGQVDLRGAFVHSSNVAVAMASESINIDTMYTMLKNFGFGSPTGLPLPGESHGILNPTNKWSVRSKPTIAIGQEVGVSAIQIVAAATALANGGILLQPRIVNKVTAADGTIVKQYPRKSVREVISPKTAKIILEMMEQTVVSPQGTSRRAAVAGLRISAKSGTAQITDPETGKYSTDRFLSSVIGIFPTDDPKLIVYVVLENPRGSSIYGAQTAAPVLRDIAMTTAPLYGIPIDGNVILEHSNSVRIQNTDPLPMSDILHDMTGYSKRMILSYMGKDDIKWIIKGEGWVVFQFPPPGTPIEKGMSVFLELE